MGVIPAEAGIHLFGGNLNPRFRGGDSDVLCYLVQLIIQSSIGFSDGEAGGVASEILATRFESSSTT